MTYRNQQEAHRDALDIERNSILAPDDDEEHQPAHKTPYYIQRMFDAADHQRDMERDDKLTGDRK